MKNQNPRLVAKTRRGTHLLPIRLGLILCLVLSTLPFAACGKSDLHKLHDSLNQAAKALNAAARTNRQLYEGGAYGPVNTDKSVQIRAKAATVIHKANENLILALNLAKGLTEATFDHGKLAVLQALAQAGAGLRTGEQTVDLILQTVATLITQATVIIQAFQSNHLKYVLPEIKTWQIREVNV
jgi:hypothetical protein